MKQAQSTTAVTRWLLCLLGLFGLAMACLFSVLLIYGQGSWQPAARLEATSLATAEISELIGTQNYGRVQAGQPHSLLTALMATLDIPFVNPLNMLSAEFPQTTAGVPAASATQSSMMRSLTTWESSSKKVALGWIQPDTTAHTIDLIQQNPGINVISPQWLMVWSSDGSVHSSVQPGVVEFAHKHHIQVWALFTNQFSAGLTHDVLADPKHRTTLVEQVVRHAIAAHLDGINVDFESMRTSDRDLFTAFIRELHERLAANHITLSVDITPDIVFLQDTDVFFHAGLAAYCDYVILMAYDEHWGGDREPGPVADVPWVTTAVNDLLNTGVPADKMVLGLPFYTRFWHVHSDGSVTNEDYAVSKVDGILQAHAATPKWDPSLGVAYAKYGKPDGYEEVWYETNRTLEHKLGLVNDTGLAGIAVWSLHWSDEHTWSTVLQALRQTVS